MNKSQSYHPLSRWRCTVVGIGSALVQVNRAAAAVQVFGSNLSSQQWFHRQSCTQPFYSAQVFGIGLTSESVAAAAAGVWHQQRRP
jgi:3-dehydroquinate dehydratase